MCFFFHLLILLHPCVVFPSNRLLISVSKTNWVCQRHSFCRNEFALCRRLSENLDVIGLNRSLYITRKPNLSILSVAFTANDINLTTVYFVAKSDDKLNQSVITFHLRILITVINNDVVFINRTCDKTDLKHLDQLSRKESNDREPLPVAMAGLEARNFLKVLFLLSVPTVSKCSAKLNVFLDGREVSRFLYGE